MDISWYIEHGLIMEKKKSIYFMGNDNMKTQWKYYNYTYKFYDVNLYTTNVAGFAIPSFTYINQFASIH